jgi:hypothetical protein
MRGGDPPITLMDADGGGAESEARAVRCEVSCAARIK